MSTLRERINKLSYQQKVLLAKQISVKNNEEAIDGFNQRIIAYFMADGIIEKKELRSYLKSELPEYMIPSRFIQIDEFPKLPNGKIDSKSLELLADENLVSSVKETVTAKTDKEKQLIKIWEEVLSFQPIRLNDNFFEIGGDSILSIQIVSKARQKGIFLAPNQIFEHQTISELALFAKSESKKLVEETIAGNVPLLPIQHWFFEEHKNAPHHWNRAVIFERKERFDAEILRKSVGFLVNHHDALRLEFSGKNGINTGFISVKQPSEFFQHIDFSELAEVDLDEAVKLKSAELQSKLDLSKSSLFQAVIFDCGENGVKLLFFAHHLVIDSISLRILFEDLEQIYAQLENGETPSLVPKTSSYKKWSEQLVENSHSQKVEKELLFWTAQSAETETFPTDLENELPYLFESADMNESIIDVETTANLTKSSNHIYSTKTEELIICALTSALNKWKGVDKFCLGLEKHGREGELDFSRSVGWFTTFFPVVLGIREAEDLKARIVSTKEKLRSIPNNGLNYGVLRYLRGEKSLNQKPTVLFNYLGKQNSFESNVFGKGEFVNEGAYSPKTERYNLIGINAFIKSGELHSRFDFSTDFYEPSTIENLVQHFEDELRRIVEHCSSKEEIEYTPTDFAEADLNQEDLNSLLSQIT